MLSFSLHGNYSRLQFDENSEEDFIDVSDGSNFNCVH